VLSTLFPYLIKKQPNNGKNTTFANLFQTAPFHAVGWATGMASSLYEENATAICKRSVWGQV